MTNPNAARPLNNDFPTGISYVFCVPEFPAIGVLQFDIKCPGNVTKVPVDVDHYDVKNH